MAVKKHSAGEKHLQGESGQSTLEYILLLSIIATGFAFAVSKLSDMNLASRLAQPLNDNFAHTYRYGHPKAKGYDDGGPEFHPRATDKGNNNFRIFINPGALN